VASCYFGDSWIARGCFGWCAFACSGARFLRGPISAALVSGSSDDNDFRYDGGFSDDYDYDDQLHDDCHASHYDDGCSVIDQYDPGGYPCWVVASCGE
jgi:hypothetical protein